MSSWLKIVADAWAEGESVDDGDDDVDVRRIDPNTLPQEAVFIAIVVALTTSLFIVWRLSAAIGKVFSLVKEALWFVIRLTVTIIVVTIVFNYVASEEVRREAGEFSLAVGKAVLQAQWYSRTMHLFGTATNFFQNLIKQ